MSCCWRRHGLVEEKPQEGERQWRIQNFCACVYAQPANSFPDMPVGKHSLQGTPQLSVLRPWAQFGNCESRIGINKWDRKIGP